MRVSASLHPTSQKAFHDIIAIQAEIEDLFTKHELSHGSETERVTAVKMKAKFQKYLGSLEDMNQLLLVARVLDPMYKLRNFSKLLVCQTMLKFDDYKV